MLATRAVEAGNPRAARARAAVRVAGTEGEALGGINRVIPPREGIFKKVLVPGAGTEAAAAPAAGGAPHGGGWRGARGGGARGAAWRRAAQGEGPRVQRRPRARLRRPPGDPRPTPSHRRRRGKRRAPHACPKGAGAAQGPPPQPPRLGERLTWDLGHASARFGPPSPARGRVPHSLPSARWRRN